MICAKNVYETVFKFVKVMSRILLASVFPDTVYTAVYLSLQLRSCQTTHAPAHLQFKNISIILY